MVEADTAFNWNVQRTNQS